MFPLDLFKFNLTKENLHKLRKSDPKIQPNSTLYFKRTTLFQWWCNRFIYIHTRLKGTVLCFICSFKVFFFLKKANMKTNATNEDERQLYR